MSRLNYKCWDIQNKRWLVEDEVYTQFVNQARWNSELSKQFILLQSTNIRDINDKEIFEGDIVSFRTVSRYRKHGGIKAEVMWAEEGCWYPFCDGTYTQDEQGDWFTTDFEIVGNIYDNPEILNNTPKETLP